MNSLLTVNDLLILGHPVVVGVVSATILAGVLYAVVKAQPPLRVIVVLIAAGYALWITWRVGEETWLGASMLRFAEKDAEFRVSEPKQNPETGEQSATATNSEANNAPHATSPAGAEHGR